MVLKARLLPAGIVAGARELEEVLAAILPVQGEVRQALKDFDIVIHDVLIVITLQLFRRIILTSACV